MGRSRRSRLTKEQEETELYSLVPFPPTAVLAPRLIFIPPLSFFTSNAFYDGRAGREREHRDVINKCSPREQEVKNTFRRSTVKKHYRFRVWNLINFANAIYKYVPGKVCDFSSPEF